MLAALLVTLVISETIPPVTRRIYHVGPDGAASALETWQCAAQLQTLLQPRACLAASGSPNSSLHSLSQCLVPDVDARESLTRNISWSAMTCAPVCCRYSYPLVADTVPPQAVPIIAFLVPRCVPAALPSQQIPA